MSTIVKGSVNISSDDDVSTQSEHCSDRSLAGIDDGSPVGMVIDHDTVNQVVPQTPTSTRTIHARSEARSSESTFYKQSSQSSSQVSSQPSNQSSNQSIEVYATPHPDILKSDVYDSAARQGYHTFAYALTEPIDNSVAAFHLMKSHEYYQSDDNFRGKISIQIYQDGIPSAHGSKGVRMRVMITDNGCGMTAENLKDFLSLANSPENRDIKRDLQKVKEDVGNNYINQSISQYGVGAKYAAFHIGEKLYVSTRTVHSSTVLETCMNRLEEREKHKTGAAYNFKITPRDVANVNASLLAIADTTIDSPCIVDNMFNQEVLSESNKPHFTRILIDNVDPKHFKNLEQSKFLADLAGVYHRVLHGPWGCGADAVTKLSTDFNRNVAPIVSIAQFYNGHELWRCNDLSEVTNDLQSRFYAAHRGDIFRFEIKANLSKTDPRFTDVRHKLNDEDDVVIHGEIMYFPFTTEGESHPMRAKRAHAEEESQADADDSSLRQNKMFHIIWHGRLIPLSQLSPLYFMKLPTSMSGLAPCLGRMHGFLHVAYPLKTDQVKLWMNPSHLDFLQQKLEHAIVVQSQLSSTQPKGQRKPLAALFQASVRKWSNLDTTLVFAAPVSRELSHVYQKLTMTTDIGPLVFQRGDLVNMKPRLNADPDTIVLMRVCCFHISSLPSDHTPGDPCNTSDFTKCSVICYPEPLLSIRSSSRAKAKKTAQLTDHLAEVALKRLMILDQDSSKLRELTTVEKAYAKAQLSEKNVRCIVQEEPDQTTHQQSLLSADCVWPAAIQVLRECIDDDIPVEERIVHDGLIVRSCCNHEFGSTLVKALTANNEQIANEKVVRSMYRVKRGDDVIRSYNERAPVEDSSIADVDDEDTSMDQSITSRRTRRRHNQSGRASATPAPKLLRRLPLNSFRDPSYRLEREPIDKIREVLTATGSRDNDHSTFRPLTWPAGVFQIEYKMAQKLEAAEGDRDHVQPVTVTLVIAPGQPKHFELKGLPTKLCLGQVMPSEITVEMRDGCQNPNGESRHRITPQSVKGSVKSDVVPARCVIKCDIIGLDVKHNDLAASDNSYVITGFALQPDASFRLSSVDGQDVECRSRFYDPESNELLHEHRFTVKLMPGKDVKLIKANLPTSLTLPNNSPLNFELHLRDQFGNSAFPIVKPPSHARLQVSYPRVTVLSMSPELLDMWGPGKIAPQPFSTGSITHENFRLPHINLPKSAFIGRASITVEVKVLVETDSKTKEVTPVTIVLRPNRPLSSPPVKLATHAFPFSICAGEPFGDQLRVYCVDSENYPVMISATQAASIELKLELIGLEAGSADHAQEVTPVLVFCDGDSSQVSHFTLSDVRLPLKVGKYKAHISDLSNFLQPSDAIESVEAICGPPVAMKLFINSTDPKAKAHELVAGQVIPDRALVDRLFVWLYDQNGNQLLKWPQSCDVAVTILDDAGAPLELDTRTKLNEYAGPAVCGTDVTTAPPPNSYSRIIKPFLFKFTAGKMVTLKASFMPSRAFPLNIPSLSITLKVGQLPGRVFALTDIMASCKNPQLTEAERGIFSVDLLNDLARSKALMAGCTIDLVKFRVCWKAETLDSPFLHPNPFQSSLPDLADFSLVINSPDHVSHSIDCKVAWDDEQGYGLIDLRPSEPLRLQQADLWAISVIHVEGRPQIAAMLSQDDVVSETCDQSTVLAGPAAKLLLAADSNNPTVSNAQAGANLIASSIKLSLVDQFGNNLHPYYKVTLDDQRDVLSAEMKGSLKTMQPTVNSADPAAHCPGVTFDMEITDVDASVVFKNVRVQADLSTTTGSFELLFQITGCAHLQEIFRFEFTNDLRVVEDSKNKRTELQRQLADLKTQQQTQRKDVRTFETQIIQVEEQLNKSIDFTKNVIDGTIRLVKSLRESALIPDNTHSDWTALIDEYQAHNRLPTDHQSLIHMLAQLETGLSAHRASLEIRKGESTYRVQSKRQNFGDGYLGRLGELIKTTDRRLAHTLTRLKSGLLLLHVVTDSDCAAYKEIARQKGKALILAGQNTPRALDKLMLPHLEADSRECPTGNPRHVRQWLHVMPTANAEKYKDLIMKALGNHFGGAIAIDTPAELYEYVALVSRARDVNKKHYVQIPSLITLEEKIFERTSGGVADHSQPAQPLDRNSAPFLMNTDPPENLSESLKLIHEYIPKCQQLQRDVPKITNHTPLATKLDQLKHECRDAQSSLSQIQQSVEKVNSQLGIAPIPVPGSAVNARAMNNAIPRRSSHPVTRSVRFQDHNT